MARFVRKLAFLPILILVGYLGCDFAGDRAADSATGPRSLHTAGPSAAKGDAQSYALVTDRVPPDGTVLTASATIGLNGGTLRIVGHTLTVPSGAIAEPAVFTLNVLPSGYVEVDLSATVSTLTGGLVDVGSKGFAKPVPITLTYARATNVKNPESLRILRITSSSGYGSYEVLPSQVDTNVQTVTTQLDHFSRYAMGYPH